MEKKEKLKRIYKYYENKCKKIGLDPQKWDWRAELDIELTLFELKSIVDEYIEKNMTVTQKAEQMTRKATQEEQERYTTEILAHQMEVIQESNRKYFQELNTDIPNIIQKLDKPIYDAVSKLIHTSIPLVIIEGRGGNGKTSAVDYTIAKEGAGNKTMITTTTLSKSFLYRLLYNNRNEGDIICFRDINPFTKELLNIFKAATETKKVRMIHKNCYSKENKDLLDSFEYKGKQIIEVNSIPTESDIKQDINALMSRALYIPFHLSREEIKSKMKAIATEDWQKEVTEELLEFCKRRKDIPINLRTQWYAFKNYEWAKKKGIDWKKTMETELKIIGYSPDFWKIYALIGKEYIGKTQLVRMLVTSEGYGIRTAKRRIQDLMDAGILHQYGKQIGIKMIEELEQMPPEAIE